MTQSPLFGYTITDFKENMLKLRREKEIIITKKEKIETLGIILVYFLHKLANLPPPKVAAPGRGPAARIKDS
ncbi:UNVERIFIED_CONTAM: hypothetical protein NCL1_34657 [Trichonephila clavipes]